MKSIREGELSQNTKLSRNPFVTVASHEIPQKTAMKIPMQTWLVFSRKIIT
jgi:hypothetical protein